MIGNRGFGLDSKFENLKLKTAKFFSGASIHDVIEPISVLYEKYCKPYGKKTFAVGISMGGILLIKVMKHLHFLTAAISGWSPLDSRGLMMNLEQ